MHVIVSRYFIANKGHRLFDGGNSNRKEEEEDEDEKKSEQIVLPHCCTHE
jgi:hypothetical protein